MSDPTAPCPVCRAHVPTVDGNLILHRDRDQLGPCPAGQVPNPGVVDEARWPELSRAVKARREVLRLGQDLTGHGGPSDLTTRRIERGETQAVSNKTRDRLESALRWEFGTIDKILSGTLTADEAVALPGAPESRAPGVDEGEAEVGRCEDQFTNLFDRRFWCDLKAGHLGAHREGTTNWASGQSEAFRVHAERDQLRARLAVVGPVLDAARALVDKGRLPSDTETYRLWAALDDAIIAHDRELEEGT